MNRESKYKKIEEKLIYFITFFSFSGYYAGLALVISLGFMHFSRYYSVPLRIITTFIMIYVIVHNIKSFNSQKKKYIMIIFCLSI